VIDFGILILDCGKPSVRMLAGLKWLSVVSQWWAVVKSVMKLGVVV
jgi:hypothetical protein